ncbi:MAG TPA: hypothetical protein PLN63_00220 [Paludibacteraceae bacterium]|nr:hypothetical protein [Paludibacteraceae bacterium]HPH62036.1 hypothetical protein [Paludibacteraceae bacterium]
MQIKESETRIAFREKLNELMLDDVLMDDIDRIYIPLAKLISEGLNMASKTQIIGINGAQGTGKTTLCNLLKVVLETGFDMKVAQFSIDDFYLTRKERVELSEKIHPLLISRGVAGTHDIALGQRTIDALCNAGSKTVTNIPSFDKSTDDRFPASKWQKFTGRPDVILFDGWLVGAVEQPEEDLRYPINMLEETEDSEGIWRHYVNDQLKNVYKPFFECLDLLIMLQVPSFDKIYEWRSLQEKKLMIQSQGKKDLRVMDNKKLPRFISHYERLTRYMLTEMPSRADMLFRVNDDHRIVI